ncbi:MAG: hypothetical protein ACU833_14655 [Gammaproteobacteria bacterium]
MRQFILSLFFTLVLAAPICFSTVHAAQTEYRYDYDGKSYRYIVEKSGDNFHFEFIDKTPDTLIDQYKTGVHVLTSLFDDDSIKLENRKNYIRERARCSLFEGGFYNYTFCILPNEFSGDKPDRLRGFVTQMPNWKWMVAWILLPASLIFGAVFFIKRKH